MGDWKNDRAEVEMKLAGDKMMREAADAKFREETAKWDKMKESLYVGSEREDDSIDWVVDMIRHKYELPTEKK